MFDLKKAMEMKKKMEEIQQRLDSIVVEGEAGDAAYKVTVSVTASKKIRNIDISDSLFSAGDKDHLTDLLMLAIERGMEKAQQVSDAEARNMALTGGLGGLFGS